MGTGVVIDPRGYILTNNHVIADGQQKDFVITVNVTFGDLTPTGRMSRQEKSYDAVVVKADPVRDLAIVKVKDAPAKLTTVKLAKSAPQIAEKVISVGHAGIGFLWAAKTCNVASIGERQQDASILAGLDCSRTDPASSPEVAARQKKSCDEQKKMMADSFLAKTQGLAVQTDCAITHGDSGGPLVNAAGEIVGLNQSISADLATASFHVHLDEIRDFASSFGEEPVAILPDPYCDGGSEPHARGPRPRRRPRHARDARRQHGYPRRLRSHERPHRPRSGSLHAQEGSRSSRSTRRSRSSRSVTRSTSGTTPTAIRASTCCSSTRTTTGSRSMPTASTPRAASRKTRKRCPEATSPRSSSPIRRCTRGSGRSRPRSAARSTRRRRRSPPPRTSVTVPDPALGAGTQGRLVDTDGNGKPDMVFVRGAFSRGLLIDADEDSIGSLKDGDSADEVLKAKKVDAEIAVIVQGNTMWAIYDTDNDSKFDLALMTTRRDGPVLALRDECVEARPGGEMTPAPDQIGRKLLRPGLVALPRATRALRGSGYDIASDEGAGSLPDPLYPRGTFQFREVKGFSEGHRHRGREPHVEHDADRSRSRHEARPPTPTPRRS